MKEVQSPEEPRWKVETAIKYLCHKYSLSVLLSFDVDANRIEINKLQLQLH